VDFLDEDIPEGDHLEYEGPQNKPPHVLSKMSWLVSPRWQTHPAGQNPPYNIRNKGVFRRVGEADLVATNRDLEQLFERRSEAGTTPKTEWAQACEVTLSLPRTEMQSRPHVVVCLAPKFPPEVLSVRWGSQSDDLFQSICSRLLVPSSYLVTSPNSIFHAPYLHDSANVDVSFACGFSRGGTGVRSPAYLTPNASVTPDPDECKPSAQVNFVHVWQELRNIMLMASEWPKFLAGEGDLRYHFGIGGMNRAALVLPTEGLPRKRASLSIPLKNLGLGGWATQGVWSSGESANSVVDRHIESLARQFQLISFGRPHVRAWLEAMIGN
jgi:hypothetical protein